MNWRMKLQDLLKKVNGNMINPNYGKEFEKELEKLYDEGMKNDNVIDLDKYVKDNASPELKKFFKEQDKMFEEYEKQGILAG